MKHRQRTRSKPPHPAQPHCVPPKHNRAASPLLSPPHLPPCPMTTTFKVGQRVGIKGKSLQGVIRWMGTAEFAEGNWIGVELDKPEGKNNGTVKDPKTGKEKSYFECPDKHGMMVRAAQLELIKPGGPAAATATATATAQAPAGASASGNGAAAPTATLSAPTPSPASTSAAVSPAAGPTPIATPTTSLGPAASAPR